MEGECVAVGKFWRFWIIERYRVWICDFYAIMYSSFLSHIAVHSSGVDESLLWERNLGHLSWFLPGSGELVLLRRVLPGRVLTVYSGSCLAV